MTADFKPCAELAEYVGRPLEIVQERCRYAPVELAWRWPEYAHDPALFYREQDLYVFDLTMYHDQILEPNGLHAWFRHALQRLGVKQLLDVGCGCGDWALHALEAGAVHVDCIDFDGPMKEYFRWRLRKRGLEERVTLLNVDALGAAIPGVYDAVVAMDVFEHVPDPEPMIDKVRELAPHMFCNPEDVHYSWLYPMHVSRFDLSSRFEHVDRYLYKSKACAK